MLDAFVAFLSVFAGHSAGHFPVRTNRTQRRQRRPTTRAKRATAEPGCPGRTVSPGQTTFIVPAARPDPALPGPAAVAPDRPVLVGRSPAPPPWSPSLFTPQPPRRDSGREPIGVTAQRTRADTRTAPPGLPSPGRRTPPPRCCRRRPCSSGRRWATPPAPRPGPATATGPWPSRTSWSSSAVATRASSTSCTSTTPVRHRKKHPIRDKM